MFIHSLHTSSLVLCNKCVYYFSVQVHGQARPKSGTKHHLGKRERDLNFREDTFTLEKRIGKLVVISAMLNKFISTVTEQKLF